MDFLEKHNLTPGKLAKIFGVFILGLVALMVAFSLITNVVGSLNRGAYDRVEPSFGGGMANFDSSMKSQEMALSSRNIIAEDSYTPGQNAENFEVTEYRADIETRKLENSCKSIFDLKEKDYVIFEKSSESDTSCNYRFKVKKDNVSEVLSVIESLKPRNLNENTQTIKKQIDDFTSEEEILKRKLQTIDDTLSSAIESYDEISKLATQTRDAGSLANIIDSKIKIIERLSTEKINTSAQLERISRLKAEQVDRLEYSYFNVYIYENKYIDIENLGDSWKRSIKKFVTDMNNVLQDISIGLVTLMAYTFQYLLYLLIIVIVAKYVWKLFKSIWKR